MTPLEDLANASCSFVQHFQEDSFALIEIPRSAGSLFPRCCTFPGCVIGSFAIPAKIGEFVPAGRGLTWVSREREPLSPAPRIGGGEI
jgi:hypothetical protein